MQVQYRRGASAPPPTWSSTSRWTSTPCTSSPYAAGLPSRVHGTGNRAPLGPLLQVRVPLHAVELPSLRGAHGVGCKAASQTSTSCTGPTSRSGRFTSISKSFTGRGGPNRPGRCTAAYLRAARGLSSQKHDFAAEGHSRTPCRWCRSQLPDFYFRNDWSL
jgi:hypothetical protein